jgi:hypothetical protein
MLTDSGQLSCDKVVNATPLWRCGEAVPPLVSRLSGFCRPQDGVIRTIHRHYYVLLFLLLINKIYEDNQDGGDRPEDKISSHRKRDGLMPPLEDLQLTPGRYTVTRPA